MNSSSNVMQLFANLKKTCSVCKEEKSIDDFSFHKHSNAYLSKCKICNAEYCKTKRGIINKDLEKVRKSKHWKKLKSDNVRYENHKSVKNKWNRSPQYYDWYYQKEFGVSLDQVKSMLVEQNNLCGNSGCGKELKLGSQENNATFAVDHDHKTGKVRGLLCTRCNCMLGHIEKNSSLVPGMMNYLNKHS